MWRAHVLVAFGLASAGICPHMRGEGTAGLARRSRRAAICMLPTPAPATSTGHGRLDRLVAAQLLASVSDVYTPTERLGFLQVRRSPSETEGGPQNTCMRSSVAASIGYWSWSTAVAGNDLARGPCL